MIHRYRIDANGKAVTKDKQMNAEEQILAICANQPEGDIMVSNKLFRELIAGIGFIQRDKDDSIQIVTPTGIRTVRITK